MVLGFSAALGLVVNAYSRAPLPIVVDVPVAAKAEPDETNGVDPNKISQANLIQATKHPAQEVRILDVRGQAEFDKGHIPRSIHFQHDKLVEAYQALQSEFLGATLIVVLCDSDQCSKAETAAETLRKLGFKNVRVLIGGWDGYKNSGYSIEESRP